MCGAMLVSALVSQVLALVSWVLALVSFSPSVERNVFDSLPSFFSDSSGGVPCVYREVSGQGNSNQCARLQSGSQRPNNVGAPVHRCERDASASTCPNFVFAYYHSGARRRRRRRRRRGLNYLNESRQVHPAAQQRMPRVLRVCGLL